MSIAKISWIEEIKKQQLETGIAFIIEQVPDVDVWTLHKLLDYVNITENFSSITKNELLEKMRLMRKYLPSACRYSLIMLAELLELEPPATENNEYLTAPKKESPLSDQSRLIFSPTF